MPNDALKQLLQAVHAEPWAHDFYAFVRRIDALRPDAPRTGQALRPAQEALRFAQPPDMDFAPAPLARLDLREASRDGQAARLYVRFFGLFGPQGPMPLHLTEYVRDRVHQHGDSAAAHFLDLFHHRLLSLFYAAWAQAQPVVQADRAQDDRYRIWLAAAAGLPAKAPAGLPAQALVFQAGLQAARSRHPEVLAKVLCQYFNVPVQVQPQIGQWLELDSGDRSRLGRTQLGRDSHAGSRVWDRQYRFRLRLGPLTLAEHNSFLPGAPAWKALRAWVARLAGPALRWDLELALKDAERPAPRLGKGGPRLGVTSWLSAPSAPSTSSAPAEPATRKTEPLTRHLCIRPGTSFLQRQMSSQGA